MIHEIYHVSFFVAVARTLYYLSHHLDWILYCFRRVFYPHSRSSHFRPTRHMADSYMAHGSTLIVEMLTSPLVLLAPIHDATRGTARTWMRNYTTSRWWEYLLRISEVLGAVRYGSPSDGTFDLGARASNHTFLDGTLHNA